MTLFFHDVSNTFFFLQEHRDMMCGYDMQNKKVRIYIYIYMGFLNSTELEFTNPSIISKLI